MIGSLGLACFLLLAALGFDFSTRLNLQELGPDQLQCRQADATKGIFSECSVAEELTWDSFGLNQLRFSAAKFFRLIIVRSRVSDVTFSKTRWYNTTVQKSDFKNVIFSQSRFIGVFAFNSVFEDCLFESSNLTAVQFVRTRFVRTHFKSLSLRRARFVQADLGGAVFHQVDLRDASFLLTNLRDAVYDRTVKLPFDRETAASLGMIYVDSKKEH